MIHCEHFICGEFNGIGYRLIKSSNVDLILTEKSLRHLTHLDRSNQTLLPEGYIAITTIRHTKDEYDRNVTWNHTILIHVQDYFKLHPPTLFKPYVITELEQPPTTLEPIIIR